MKNILKIGISLIVLMITLIIVIIIASAVILSLQKNNPLSMARKAKFMQNADSFKTELELYKQNEYINQSMDFDPNSIQANVTFLKENGKTVENKNIYDVIPSLKNVGYKDDTFVIVDGKLVYKGTVKEEQDWSKDSGITVDNGSVNIVLTAKQDMTIPYKQGKLIQYNLKMYSDQGLKEISKDALKNGIKIIDKNGKELTTQPNIDIDDISGTSNEKNTVITVDTIGIADGKYTIKINKNLIENNANKLNDEISSSEFFEIDNTAPENPIIMPSTIESVQQETVTIIYSDDSNQKQYSYDGTIWKNYIGEMTINDNCTIYARAIDKAGNISGQSTLSINNIDRVPPDAPIITPSTTASTNQNVIVTITYPSDAVIKQYSYDGTTWNNYTGTLTVSSNSTVYAIAKDAAGNVSSQSSLTISNIDKIAPDAPTIVSNTTTWTNQNIAVTITYPSDAAVKQYSYDGKTWNNYTSILSVGSNGTVYAIAKDAAGNVSSQSSLTISNIDKDVPNVPVISSNINEVNISVNITISDSGCGINIANSRYIFTQNTSLYGINDSIWNSANKFSSQTQTYNTSVQTSGNYYIQVLSVDNLNNKVVNLSSPIIVTDGLVGKFTFDNSSVQNLVNNKEYTGTGISYEDGVSGKALKISNNGQINIPIADLNISYDTQHVTISLWFKWNGENCMPVSFWLYDLWLTDDGNIGFNTAAGDLYGTRTPIVKGNFYNIIAIFSRGDVTKCVLYVNGNKLSLSQGGTPQTWATYFYDYFNISGWQNGDGYRCNGSVYDQMKIYNRALTDTEISQIANKY